MSDADDFAQLMQRLQSAASTPGTAALPEEASTAPSTTSSTPGLLPNGKKTKGRVKIKMEYINNKLRRYTTFSKRKTGIMKKAFELSTLTGTQVMLLVASETGHVYTYATKKLQPMISSDAGKALIQTCLNTPGDGADVAPSRSEFTYDAMSACTARKRKMADTSDMNTSSSSALQFQSFLPTMVPSIFSNFGEDDYNNDESGDDSDSEEAASDIVKEEDVGSPSVVVKKEEIDTDSVSETLKQTLKEALKAAASNRQQQQKRAKLQSSSSSSVSNSASRASFVAPFLLQGGANASTVFSNAVKQGDDAGIPSNTNPLFNFASIDFQKLMESAQLGVQITNAE